MANRSAFLLLCICLPLLALGQFYDGFTHHAVLDNSDAYYLYWKPGATGNDYIEFEVQVKTKGWIGLGFSPNGAMAGSDIVIMWIDANNQPHISDRHGPTEGANGFPPEDAEQNYEIVEARENATHTTIRFKRKQSTCDADDWPITTDTTRMIWAFSNNKPKSASDIKMHSTDTRGVRSVHLLYPQTKNRAREIFRQPDMTTFDVFVNNVTVPHNSRTLYWCQVFKVPKFPKKRHLVGYEMLVQPGNEKYVHHLVLYGCREDMSQYLNKPAACYDENSKISPMKACYDTLSGWAVGGEPFAYPDDMGAVWFSDEFDYVVGEFHYDNSDFTKDITDSSGMRMYLTETLRSVETGRFTMGALSNPLQMVIPPKTESFTLYTYCPAECTMNLQDEPMKIFTGMLHTHLLGVKIRVRQVRNGVELPNILLDNHYDFNYQSPIILDQHPTIQPGDDLILECEYNSKDRDVPTFGGLGTTEEMCLAYLEYYPKRQRLTEGCYSGVDAETIAKLLGAKNVTLTANSDKTTVINAKGQNQTFKDMVKDSDWGANSGKNQFGLVQDLEKLGRDEPQDVVCLIYPKNATDPKASNVSIKLEKNPTITVSFDNTDPVCLPVTSLGAAWIPTILLLTAGVVIALL
uniref:DOMON domain-containing protein n=1 Tax=Plectus sambesii TaxID=2011161 RepID=A0A914XB98_9BILA